LGEPLNDELVADSERLDFDECEVINGPGQGFTEATSAIQSFIPEPEPILPDIPSLGDAVRSLSIAETKVHQDSYLDQEVQRLVSGFVKAKLDAVTGIIPPVSSRAISFDCHQHSVLTKTFHP